MREPANQGASAAASDFSLVLGGPLYQLLRRARLSGGTLELLHRRIIALVAVAWLPLFVLSILDGVAVGTAVKVPFLFDMDLHLRFLLSLPILIAAELIVHQRTHVVVAQFVAQGLVPDSLRARFDATLESAAKLRNSLIAELLLIAIVYGVGIFVLWRYYMVLEVPTWYATPEAGLVQPKLAGWWYFFVSLPVYQFILLRWYYRLVVWTRFLWQVSRLPLAYQPLHPDGNGGIGFLAGVARAFAPLLFAQGVLLAGTLANTILYEGEVLTSFYVEVVLFVTFLVFVIVAPMFPFILPLSAAKRQGLREYSGLSRQFADEFADKWIRHAPPAGEALVGSADIQSLADLGNSFDKVRGMSVIPITRGAVAQLVIAALLPLAPLLLTLISFEELLKRIVKVLV
jgi:hypothetical protein